jgi:pseudouridine-5'-phosphate glycosidase
MTLVIGTHVRDALNRDQPVVALETALVTHGLPGELGIETALAMEDEIRIAGAVPATIGVIDGKVITGLSRDQLEFLARSASPLKASSRGLPYAIAKRQNAGLTVSATAWVASRSGIEFFATGGIGGVHYGASETGDISADLAEIARVPVAVVSAGIKSILDIGRTLEHLEMIGVPVYGYQTEQFPAFFSGISGFPAPFRVDSPDEAAAVWQYQRSIGLTGGALFACPPPDSVHQSEQLQNAIEQANREAAEINLTGGAVTPYVLRRIAEITDGASIRANVALLRNNARIAGEIAVAAMS